jgi:hypothetical protein
VFRDIVNIDLHRDGRLVLVLEDAEVAARGVLLPGDVGFC